MMFSEQFVIPFWGQMLLGASAIIIAITTIWTRVFKPFIRAATMAETMLPILIDLTKEFRETPNVFTVLDDIASQFRNNNGSSLRDVIDKLSDIVKNNSEKINTSQNNINKAIILSDNLSEKIDNINTLMFENHELAIQDRAAVSQLIKVVDRILIKVNDDEPEKKSK